MSTTNSRGLILPTVGSDVATWGGYLNNNFAYITQMFGTVLSVALSDGVTTNLSQSQTQNGTIQLTGTLTVQTIVTFPNVSGYWNIDNRTLGGYVMITTATGTNATIGIPQGKTSQIYVDITSSTPGVKFLNPADPGTYWDYASGTAPSWFTGCTSNGTTAQLPWITCDGSAVSRTTYLYLYQAIGTTWGIGDGTTTFNVPDLRNRARVSVFPSTPLLTSPLNGATVGAVSSDATQSTTLSISNMPSHTHIDSGHTHTVKYRTTASVSPGSGASAFVPDSTGGLSAAGAAITSTANLQNTGSGTPFSTNIVQPTAIAGLTFIKT